MTHDYHRTAEAERPAGDERMTFHQWFKTLPREHWCPVCRAPVTKWHEHWGARVVWRPGMVEPLIRREA